MENVSWDRWASRITTSSWLGQTQDEVNIRTIWLWDLQQIDWATRLHGQIKCKRMPSLRRLLLSLNCTSHTANARFRPTNHSWLGYHWRRKAEKKQTLASSDMKPDSGHQQMGKTAVEIPLMCYVFWNGAEKHDVMDSYIGNMAPPTRKQSLHSPNRTAPKQSASWEKQWSTPYLHKDEHWRSREVSITA